VDLDAVEHRLAAILSADAVGYSRLMALDEIGTVRTLTACREEIRSLAERHRGRIVDAPGDNLLAEFPSASEAVRCAIEVQEAIGIRNAEVSEERKMEFRIGVHLGEVLVEGERIYGDGVNIAARLEGIAEPGGVCISAAVRDQVHNKLDVGYVDLGEQVLQEHLGPGSRLSGPAERRAQAGGGPAATSAAPHSARDGGGAAAASSPASGRAGPVPSACSSTGRARARRRSILRSRTSRPWRCCPSRT